MRCKSYSVFPTETDKLVKMTSYVNVRQVRVTGELRYHLNEVPKLRYLDNANPPPYLKKKNGKKGIFEKRRIKSTHAQIGLACTPLTLIT